MNPQDDRLTPRQQRFFIGAFLAVFLCFSGVLGAGIWKAMWAQEQRQATLLARQGWSRQPKFQGSKKPWILPQNRHLSHVVRGRAGLVKYLTPYKKEDSKYQWFITLPNGSIITDATPAGYAIIQPDSYTNPTTIKTTSNSACSESAPPFVNIQVSVPNNAPLGHYQVTSIVPAGSTSDSPSAQNCSPSDTSLWYKTTFTVIEPPATSTQKNSFEYEHQ